MKYVKAVAGILILLLLFSGGFLTARPYTETEFSMDTVMTVTAYGKQAKSAVGQVFSRIRELDKNLDPRNPESQIFEINHAPADTPISLDADVFSILKAALSFSEVSQGAFDVTLYPVSCLWGFGTDQASVPEEQALQDALSKTGRDKLILNETMHTVTKTDGAVQIDLGGVAKGYASDEAVRILQEAGITSAYIDLGGNIAIIGEKPLSLGEMIKAGKTKRPYTVGIQKPGAPRGELIDVLSLSEGFVVTSGDYERFFEENGKIYHHILEPETGHPAETGLKSVTIVSKNGMMADMLSTAIFVQGKDKAANYRNECETILLVDHQFATTYIE